MPSICFSVLRLGDDVRLGFSCHSCSGWSRQTRRVPRPLGGCPRLHHFAQTDREELGGVPPISHPGSTAAHFVAPVVSERVPEGRKCQRNVFYSSSAAHELRFLSACSAVVMQADMNSLMFLMLAFINVHWLNFPCRRENGKKEGRRSFCRSMRNIQGNEDLAAALRCRMFQTAWWCQQQTSSQSLGAFNKKRKKKTVVRT